MARIVLAGAGHTHIELVLQADRFLQAGHELIVVSPEPEHPYSGMAPGFLAGVYQLGEIMLPAAELVERSGARFVAGRITAVNPQQKHLQLASGQEIDFDVLSLNIGSRTIASPQAHLSYVYPVKPIINLVAARQAIIERIDQGHDCRVAVLGGGPAGVELAAAAAHLLSSGIRGAIAPGASVALYSAGSEAIGAVRGRRAAYVRRHLSEIGVQLYEGERVLPSQIDADIVLYAGGTAPPDEIQAVQAPRAADDSLLVDRFLRSVAFQHVFAVGDCACLAGHPLDRVGVYAVRMQETLLHNVLTTASGGGHLRAFRATGSYLAGLNLGFGCGLLYKGCLTLRNEAAFLLKDRLDRRFMDRYRLTQLGG